MNNFFNNAIGWTKKPTSPRFVYPTAAKFCCCLPYKARRGCDRLFAYVSTQAREEKRPFCYYRVTTFLLLKTVLASNIQVTFFSVSLECFGRGGRGAVDRRRWGRRNPLLKLHEKMFPGNSQTSSFGQKSNGQLRSRIGR